jgi:chitinase
VEADQSFTVTLSGATGTGVSIGTAQATGGILNDDATAVSIANASTTEGNSGTKPLNFSVSLSNPSDFPVTVKLTTVAGTAGDGSDYQGVAGQTITFNPGETLKLVPVNLLGDTNTEADEIFGVNLSDVTGAAASIAQGSATGTILNDDIITTPLAIQSVSVNGGVAQRSNLETIAIKFNQAVNLADLIANGAIVDAVKLFNTTANTQVALTVSRYTYNAGTNTLTIDVTTDGFNGSRKTMLSDARYEFRLDPAVIHAATNTGNRLVDDDGTADGLRRVKFHRLEGDFNGDAAVTAADRAILNSKLLKKSNQVGYDYAVDLNGDGVINALDSALLAKMIGRTV